MTEAFVTNAFIAGELDRPFYARTDLDKYSLGVAKASNFYVDFRGGMKTRPGLRFWDYLPSVPRTFTFFTGEDSPPIVVCVFAGRFLFWAEDSFLVDPDIAISSISGNEVTVADASSFSVGDLCYIGDSSYGYEITAKSGSVLTVALPDGQTPTPSGGVIKRFYTVTNAYTDLALTTMTAHYRLDRMVICCHCFPPKSLTFSDPGFVFADELFVPSLTQPSGLAVATFKLSASGGASQADPATGKSISVFCVTAVDDEGNESLPSRPFRATEMFNYTLEAGSATITWTAVSGAVSYRVYRSIITQNNNLNIGAQLGYIGESTTPSFVDSNFIPDYTRPPPVFFSPFDSGAILTMEITAEGDDYDPNAATISVADGTGFIGYPIVEPVLSGATPDTTGPIKGVLIYSGGKNYTTSSAVTITDGVGTGATAEVTNVSPASGLSPAVSTVFQQRRVYAGTQALPLTIFASQAGREQNFSAGNPPSDSDAYTLSIDANEVIPIRHLISMRSGLLVLHSGGVFRLYGRDDGAVTPNSFVIEPQAELGVGVPAPVVINNDVLFSSSRGTSFHALAYTFYTNSFTPQEISILAPHLFGTGREPIRMVWTQEPDKLLWVLRADGALLSLTYLKEQEIFAWAQHHTDGLVKEICPYRHATRDSMVLVVERDDRIFLEELAERSVSPLAEYWGSDASVGFTFEEPVTEVNNLWHLEGRTVSILADGDALPHAVVSNGTVTLARETTTVRIGLPFECLCISLPLSDLRVTVDGRLRRIVGSAVRLMETRGLEIGTSLTTMYEMRDKGWEDWGEAIALRDDNSYVLHSARWERDAQMHFRQRYPLPAMVLGYVTEAELER